MVWLFMWIVCLAANSHEITSFISLKNNKQEAHGPRIAHLSKSAIAYLQMPCSILQVLPQPLGHKFDHGVKIAIRNDGKSHDQTLAHDMPTGPYLCLYQILSKYFKPHTQEFSLEIHSGEVTGKQEAH